MNTDEIREYVIETVAVGRTRTITGLAALILVDLPSDVTINQAREACPTHARCPIEVGEELWITFIKRIEEDEAVTVVLELIERGPKDEVSDDDDQVARIAGGPGPG